MADRLEDMSLEELRRLANEPSKPKDDLENMSLEQLRKLAQEPSEPRKEDLAALAVRGVGETARELLAPPEAAVEKLKQQANLPPALADQLFKKPTTLPEAEPQSLAGEAVLQAARLAPTLLNPGAGAAASLARSGASAATSGLRSAASRGVELLRQGVSKAGGPKEIIKDLAVTAAVDAVAPGSGLAAAAFRRAVRSKAGKVFKEAAKKGVAKSKVGKQGAEVLVRKKKVIDPFKAAGIRKRASIRRK